MIPKIKNIFNKTIKSKCNVEDSTYKQNPEKFVCNELTGYWISKKTNLGKALVKLQDTNELSKKSNIYTESTVVYCQPQQYINIFKKQIQYLHKLDDKYINALKVYTGSGYLEINKILRESNTITKNNYDEKMIPIINLIDYIFRNIPPIEENIILWRGVKLHEKIITNFVEKGYVSTTLDKSIAYRFSGQQKYKCCLFEIFVPKGTRIIPVYTCSEISNEIEAILPRDGIYTITKSDFTPKKNTIMISYKQNIPKNKFKFPMAQLSSSWKIHNNILIDNNNNEWKVEKFDNIKNQLEYLAYKLYKLFNVNTPTLKMILINSNKHLIKYKYNKKELPDSEYKKAYNDFLIDVLFCNLQVRSSLFLNDDGKLIRDDLSGVFNNMNFIDVLKTMKILSSKDISFNIKNIFANMSHSDIENSLKKIIKVDPTEIKNVIDEYYNDIGNVDKNKLYKIIIERRNDIINICTKE